MLNTRVLIMGYGVYLIILILSNCVKFPTNLTTSFLLVLGVCVILDMFDPLLLGISSYPLKTSFILETYQVIQKALGAFGTYCPQAPMLILLFAHSIGS